MKPFPQYCYFWSFIQILENISSTIFSPFLLYVYRQNPAFRLPVLFHRSWFQVEQKNTKLANISGATRHSGEPKKNSMKPLHCLFTLIELSPDSYTNVSYSFLKNVYQCYLCIILNMNFSNHPVQHWEIIKTYWNPCWQTSSWFLITQLLERELFLQVKCSLYQITVIDDNPLNNNTDYWHRATEICIVFRSSQ